MERHDAFIIAAGETMLASGEASHGGWRFPSKIQDGNFQTDRDVGASSVGEGALRMADEYPEDGQWLDGAGKIATWLEAVSRTDENGRYWVDYVNDDDASESAYTSFDDGVIGISDFFYDLYERTQDPRHKQIAIEGLLWTLAQARNIAADGEDPVYNWRWDTNGSKKDIRTGMGEGMCGIIYGLAAFYERLKDSDPEIAERCKDAIEGGIRYFDQVMNDLEDQVGIAGVLPERPYAKEGDTSINSGYLSGVSGQAFVYMHLYKIFGNEEYKERADKCFDWIENTDDGPMVVTGTDAATWKIENDPEGGDNEQYATGFEEGAPGIGWSALETYKLTGDQRCLNIARKAGNWLISVAIDDGEGALSWRKGEHVEDDDDTEEAAVVHTNINNGVAGVLVFMKELADVTGEATYANTADKARAWIMKTAIRQNGQISWGDNEDGNDYAGDPSWHWGSSGIVNALICAKGGKTNFAGMQPGLTKR